MKVDRHLPSHLVMWHSTRTAGLSLWTTRSTEGVWSRWWCCATSTTKTRRCAPSPSARSSGRRSLPGWRRGCCGHTSISGSSDKPTRAVPPCATRLNPIEALLRSVETTCALAGRARSTRSDCDGATVDWSHDDLIRFNPEELRSFFDLMQPGAVLFFPLFNRKNSSAKASELGELLLDRL